MARKKTCIYERAYVKGGRRGFCAAGLPHIPFRRRLRSIWPISDLAADESVVQPATHPLSPRPRESFSHLRGRKVCGAQADVT
jgi:hypothetical protein